MDENMFFDEEEDEEEEDEDGTGKISQSLKQARQNALKNATVARQGGTDSDEDEDEGDEDEDEEEESDEDDKVMQPAAKAKPQQAPQVQKQ